MAKLDLNKLASTPAAAPAPTEAPKPAGLAFLKQKASAEPEVAPAATPATPKPGGLAFLSKQRVGNSSTEPTPAPTPTPTPAPSPAASDDLAALMDSEGGGSKPKLASGVMSRFADEEPATGPERVMPTDADKSMHQFVESLDSVYKIVHEPDLLGSVIKNIMMELSQKPEYRKLIQPKDVHTMIKGMRDSMGMARIKKEESKAKRAGGGRKKVAKVDDLDALAALDEAFSGVDL